MRTIEIILAGCVFALAAGCESADSKQAPLANQIRTLQQEQTQLQSQLKQAETENEQLKEQIQVLSSLPKETRPENIYSLSSVKITRYTNLYDKDKDGKKETLIVYIQPIDQDGHIIKAAGTVDVELLDLNKPDGPVVLSKWQVTAQELRKLWFKTLLTLNYRLTFQVGDKVGDFKEPLTVKITFTDYLTGKVFKELKVIKP